MLLLALLLVVLPWLIGRYRAQQALLATAGWERAERIEREQRMAIDQERLRERSRIAEDMHDSVGHELSLIALRAAALELDPRCRRSTGGPRPTLREAAATATERLGEIIGVLRDADAPVDAARRERGRHWSTGPPRPGSRCGWSRRATASSRRWWIGPCTASSRSR